MAEKIAEVVWVVVGGRWGQAADEVCDEVDWG